MTSARYQQLRKAYGQKCDDLLALMINQVGTAQFQFTSCVFDVYHKRCSNLINRYYSQES